MEEHGEVQADGSILISKDELNSAVTEMTSFLTSNPAKAKTSHVGAGSLITEPQVLSDDSIPELTSDSNSESDSRERIRRDRLRRMFRDIEETYLALGANGTLRQ